MNQNQAMQEKEYSNRLRTGIRAVLEAKGFDPNNQSELSAICVKIDCNRRWLEQILNGKVKSPRGVNLRKLMAFLDTTEAEVLAIADNAENIPSGKRCVNENVRKPNTFLAASRVCEYDIRALNPQTESPQPMITIQERPVIAIRRISPTLMSRLHPNADPAVIRISGDSMAPTIHDGACVLVDADVRAPSPAGLYVLWDGYSHIVARCQILIGTSPTMVRVTTDNPATAAMEVPLSDLAVCGSVVAILDPNTWAENSAVEDFSA